MSSFRYLHYDVFTDTALEGNQLAVFPQPAGLTTGTMQAIAREMNFSESTFIFPSETPGTDVRMRIFTPAEELPMAGHPTIGSTFALAHEGVIRRGQQQFVFGLGVGPTPVSLEWKGDALDFAWMTQKNPAFGGEVSDRAAFAGALGVSLQDLAAPAPQVVSCGVPFLFAALGTRKAVDGVSVDPAAFREVCRASGIDELPLFIFTTDRTGSAADEAVYSRMLAPGFGIAEDPATGGASGPLGCYLYKHQMIDRGKLAHAISLQGVKMKRPSRIHISIEAAGGAITRVRVGGRSVLVGEGRLTF
ncbi:MAG TPA: PhzF family phenazine biosynthesis protein [Vicinamibacterales bacterium]|nr:PhzF family phenazine biosynthesis protein [Vicinamibacterales bacterium]